MAKEPRSLQGRSSRSRAAPAVSARRPRRRSRARAPRSRSATSTSRSPTDGRSAGRRGRRLRARRHAPRLVRQLPRPGLRAARTARRDDQQRRDHADRPVRRRDRRDRSADDRHQPARRDLRDEARDSGHERSAARGHIVNLASQAGKVGLPGGATYCATKHAVVGLSEAVRAELSDTGDRGLGGDAGGGQHRARLRPAGHPRRQASWSPRRSPRRSSALSSSRSSTSGCPRRAR